MVHKTYAKKTPTVVAHDVVVGVDTGTGGPHKKRRGAWWWALVSGSVLVGLCALTLGVLWYQARQEVSNTIAPDIARLTAIFRDINNTCGISGFAHDVNYVDFLTVTSFVGSEVGAMHLRNPRNWKGPYLADNPTVQTKLYQIIHTKQGWALVPGAGVTLSNGLVMGKDIIINEQTDMSALVESAKLKSRDGRPLAALISTQVQLGGAQATAPH